MLPAVSLSAQTPRITKKGRSKNKTVDVQDCGCRCTAEKDDTSRESSWIAVTASSRRWPAGLGAGQGRSTVPLGRQAATETPCRLASQTSGRGLRSSIAILCVEGRLFLGSAAGRLGLLRVGYCRGISTELERARNKTGILFSSVLPPSPPAGVPSLTCSLLLAHLGGQRLALTLHLSAALGAGLFLRG